MLLAVAALLLAADVPPPARLASVGFRAVEVDARKADFLGNFFAQKLSEATGLPVSTPEEMTAVLGLERQRQLMGCSDEANSCMAEIAAGLGVDGLVLGSVARVGEGYAVTVKVVATKDAAALASLSAQAASEPELLTWLTQAAQKLGPEVRGKLAPQAGPAPAAAVAAADGNRFVRSKAWIPTVIGGAFVITGAVLYAMALGTSASIAGGSQSIHSQAELDAALQAGHTQNVAGAVFLIAGVASLAVAGALVLLAAPEQHGLSLSVGAFPQGLVVGGRF